MTKNEFRGRVVQKDGATFISSTSFQEYARCPKKFHYNKILKVKIRPEFGGTPAALVFGKAIHEVMEEYMRTGNLIEFGDLWTPDYIKDEGELFYSNQEADFETLRWKGQAIANQMVITLKNAGYEETLKSKTFGIMVEKQDYVLIDRENSLLLTRTIDAMAMMGGVPTVIDFKTAYRMYTVGLQDEASDQLTAYLMPHKFSGIPQPKQAMFIVGTKTKTPASAFFPRKHSPRREKKFIVDLKMLHKAMKNNIYPRCRGDQNCGSERSPRCDFRPLCYPNSSALPSKELYFKGDY